MILGCQVVIKHTSPGGLLLVLRNRYLNDFCVFFLNIGGCENLGSKNVSLEIFLTI